MNNERISRIYDQLSAIKSELEDLADETSLEALEDAASDIDDVLDDLEEIVDTSGIKVIVENKDDIATTIDVTENPEKLLELLTAMSATDSNDEESEETDSDEASDNVFCAILESIRIMNETMNNEQLDSAIARIQAKLSGEE